MMRFVMDGRGAAFCRSILAGRGLIAGACCSCGTGARSVACRGGGPVMHPVVGRVMGGGHLSGSAVSHCHVVVFSAGGHRSGRAALATGGIAVTYEYIDIRPVFKGLSKAVQ